MKAVLVLDEMPKNCRECKLHEMSDKIDKLLCVPLNTSVVKFAETRYTRCPLKALPEKKKYPDTCNDLSHADGWNFCLDEITN